jgi:uncharacterized membrane protein
MTARLRKLLTDLGETFWLLPGLMVLAGIVAARLLVLVDRQGLVPPGWADSGWLYDGGATGARTLLGAVASSTIGVAGTVFSITIAALSLAAGQMGPRLLRNFTRDRSNQLTLGAFLGTFSYALMVLRSVRTAEEGDFVPYLALSVALLLAFACVGMLVFFVGHMAGRINVDTVIELVAEEVRGAIQRLTRPDPGTSPPPPALWRNATVVRDARHGYLQQLDEAGLADWAAAHGTVIRLLVRPGDHVFPGAPIAWLTQPAEGAEAAIRRATALGPQRTSADDLEFAVRQLVEVAVRAMSPGVNDPHTAMSVLDRLGTALCELAPRHLPSGVLLRDGRPALVVTPFDYDGLADAMFHLIRQSATGTAAVMIRLLEVLAAVLGVEADPARQASLRRHARLVLEDARREIANPSDLADVERRFAAIQPED